MSIIGVEGIISFSGPILITIYPVVIVLSFLNLFNNYIKDDLIYKTTVYFTLGISLISGIEALGWTDFIIVRWVSKLPLWENGFAWILISFIGLFLGYVFSKIRLRGKYK